MSQEELMNAIAEIEREIAILPEGSITKKKIRDKEYYYHRIARNGKRVEKYIDFSFIYDEVKHLYCEDNGRPSIDPVVLFKLVFIQTLDGCICQVKNGPSYI